MCLFYLEYPCLYLLATTMAYTLATRMATRMTTTLATTMATTLASGHNPGHHPVRPVLVAVCHHGLQLLIAQEEAHHPVILSIV